MRISWFTVKFLAIPFVSFLLWESASTIANVKNFPHSWEVLSDLLSLLAMKEFWESLMITSGITLVGFFVGTLLAVIIGISISLWNSGEKITSGTINFFRSIPSVVFLPLLIATLGASTKTSVILTIFVVHFISINFVVRGMNDLDSSLIETTRTLELSILNRVRYLYLPSLLLIIGTGMRLSASRAFGTVVVTGILTGSPGLGSSLGFANSSSNLVRVFSYVIVMGILGVLIYSLFTHVENQLFRWRTTL